MTSFLPMVMSILGGVGTFVGPVIGAGVSVYVENFSSIYFPERWPLILGGLFVVTIMFARQGIGVYLWKVWVRVSEHAGIGDTAHAPTANKRESR